MQTLTCDSAMSASSLNYQHFDMRARECVGICTQDKFCGKGVPLTHGHV